jgi:CubicO group peptidase (beta-lactamase class C family)
LEKEILVVKPSNKALLVVGFLLVISLLGYAVWMNIVNTSDYWQTSTPEEQGMDSEILEQAMDFILEQEEHNLHSLLVIRNGYVVLDAYFYPFTTDSLHDVASVTKSVTSTLIGIAIGKGHIQDIHQPVLSFFPDRQIANLSDEKEAISLEDLLTMRSGFECLNEPSEETLIEMMNNPDWIQFALDLPVVTEPGTKWEYCSPDSHLLAAIIQQASGTEALEFAQEHLFTPLGISDIIWPVDPQGIIHGFGSLRLTPHDIAKIGYLYLKNGIWENEQILPPTWVEAATSVKPNLDFYGYQWWLSPEMSHYSAHGRGGQDLYIFPDENLIVVVTGNGNRISELLIDSFLLPAITAGSPLPANPEGVAALEAKAQQAAESPSLEPELVLPFPEIAPTVSGQTYSLKDNAYGLTTVTLSFPASDEALISFTVTSGSLFGGETYEWLVGLDNIPRIQPGRYDIQAAASGAWVNEKSFEAYIDEIGNNFHFLLRLTFESEQVTLFMVDTSAALPPITLHGSLDTSNPETVSTGVMVSTRMDITRLHSGPGSGYPKVGMLEKGDLMAVIGRNEAGDWLEISPEVWVPVLAVNVIGEEVSTLPVVEVLISAEDAFAAQWEAENVLAFENPPIIDESTLRRYVGTYEMLDFDSSEPLYSITLLIEDDALVVEWPDQVTKLHPATDTLFIIGRDTRLEFLAPKDRPITVIFLQRDGPELFGVRTDD